MLIEVKTASRKEPDEYWSNVSTVTFTWWNEHLEQEQESTVWEINADSIDEAIESGSYTTFVVDRPWYDRHDYRITVYDSYLE